MGVSIVSMLLQGVAGFFSLIIIRYFLSKKNSRLLLLGTIISLLILSYLIKSFFGYIRLFQFVIAGMIVGEWLYGKYEFKTIFNYLYTLKDERGEYEEGENGRLIVIVNQEEIEDLSLYDLKVLKEEERNKNRKNLKKDYDYEIRKYEKRMKNLYNENP